MSRVASVKHPPLVVLTVAGLLGAVFATALYQRVRGESLALSAQLAATARHAADLDRRLAAAVEENSALAEKLLAGAADLGEARGKLSATESRLAAEAARAADAARALDETRQKLATREAETAELASALAALRDELSETRSSLASPEAVSAYKHTIVELERQLASVQNGPAVPVAGGTTAVFSSRRARSATVLSVGPESAFVVLAAGSVRGIEVGQECRITRGTAVLATALLSDVRPNFSVAQVRPDSLRGALQKGDSAILSR